MKRRNKVLILVLVVILSILIFCEINNYYPEKFEIKGADVELLKVAGFDNDNKCYLLTDSIGRVNSNDIFIVAIRFKLDYISLKHESLFNTPHSPWGAYGHIDSLVGMNFYYANKNNKQILNDSLSDASLYQKFQKKNVVSLAGQSHHTTGGCYLAQTYSSTKSFIRFYNSNMYNLSSKMEDYHFYKINSEMASFILKNGGGLEIKLQNGKTILAYFQTNLPKVL